MRAVAIKRLLLHTKDTSAENYMRTKQLLDDEYISLTATLMSPITEAIRYGKEFRMSDSLFHVIASPTISRLSNKITGRGFRPPDVLCGQTDRQIHHIG